MLDSLRFVQGAVAKKDYSPVLTHFHIENGVIRGYNGSLGLCCPIDLDINVKPLASQLVKAVQTCKETIQIHLTKSGRLSLKSGKFKALIDCVTEEFPSIEPEGHEIPLTGGSLLSVFKTVAPFIAEDASRPWARGILLRGQSAFATNNCCLIEHWLGYDFPVEVNIPKPAITELLRIGEEPKRLQLAEGSVTFHYSNQRWLRTQTYTTVWPDLSRILDDKSAPQLIPEGFFDAITDLLPFVDPLGRVYFRKSAISTGVEEAAATIEVPDIEDGPCFNSAQLLLLKGRAQTIDFSSFPKPCLFYGDRIRGAIVGMRMS